MRVVALLNALAGHGHAAVLGGVFRALRREAPDSHVIVVSGGAMPPEGLLPDDVELVQLPALVPTQGLFSEVGPRAAGVTRTEQRRLRATLLRGLLKRATPDVLLVEHYPFGRHAFAKELEPLLDQVRARWPTTSIVSSLSVLGARAPGVRHDALVCRALQRHFDAVLVHTDARVESLWDDYDPAVTEGVRVRHTGYVLPFDGVSRPAREEVRSRLGVERSERFVVAHAGGGRDGALVLHAALDAHAALHNRVFGNRWRMLLVAGSAMRDADASSLETRAARLRRVRFDRHRTDLGGCVAAADAVVSMCGYASAAEACAAGVPILFLPRRTDNEQVRRADRLERLGYARVAPVNTDGAAIAGWLRGLPKGARRTDALQPLDFGGARSSARAILDIAEARASISDTHTRAASREAGAP